MPTRKKPAASGVDGPVGGIVAEIDKLVDQQAEADDAREIERQQGRPAGEPMGADEARTLTDEIKECLTVGAEKIVQAYTERADVALGYQSWDAYCIAEFSSLRLRVPREERPEMVASLRHAGLSIRAIASATGAGVGTIHREIEASAAARAMGGVPFGTPARLVDQEQIGDADQIAEELIAAEPPDGVTEPNVHEAAARARSPHSPKIAERRGMILPTTIIGTDGKTYAPQRKPAPKPEPTPTQRRSDNEIKFIVQVRSTARDLDTLMVFAKTLDVDAKRKVLDKHREDLESCVAKLAAVVEQFAAVDSGRGDRLAEGATAAAYEKADASSDESGSDRQTRTTPPLPPPGGAAPV